MPTPFQLVWLHLFIFRCVESQTNASWSWSKAPRVKSCPWGLNEGVWVFFHPLILHNSPSQLLMGDSCGQWSLGAWLGNSPPPVSLHRKALPNTSEAKYRHEAGGHVTLMYGGHKNREGMREGKEMTSMGRRVGSYAFWSRSSTLCQASLSGCGTALWPSFSPTLIFLDLNLIVMWATRSAKREALKLATSIPVS